MVSSREEQEKLNVWVALLNLENMYGTEESLKKVFERALQFCEPLPVYQQLADIYAKSEKIKVGAANLITPVVCKHLWLCLLGFFFFKQFFLFRAGGRESV